MFPKLQRSTDQMSIYCYTDRSVKNRYTLGKYEQLMKKAIVQFVNY